MPIVLQESLELASTGSKQNGGEMEIDFQEELELNLKRDMAIFIDIHSPYTVLTNFNDPTVKKQIKFNQISFSRLGYSLFH